LNIVRRRKIYILVIFLISWIVSAIVIISQPYGSIINSSFPIPQSVTRIVHSFILAFFLLPVYLSAYSAIEYDSVSSLILLYAEKAGARGFTKKEVQGITDDQHVIINRLDEMINIKTIMKENMRYSITRRGKLFLFLFVCPKRMLNSSRIEG